MRALIVGGGGREHALAWKLAQDNPDISLHAAPGNPGIAELAECHAVSATDLAAQLTLARDLDPDLVIIGPEGPLAAGLADVLRGAGIAVFGPSAAAALIESSKSYAKNLMMQRGIPTARATTHTTADTALRAAKALGSEMVVIKASGLAAGKGVSVVNVRDAESAIADVFRLGAVGSQEVLVEEFMEGEELSLFAVCDGENAVLLPASQDHKRLLDGDRGPNTGGMGAYSPVSIATPALLARTREEIILPILAALKDDGAPFTGLLYAGLMISPGGSPQVVEFNCRFGDPETQAVLPLLESQLWPLLEGASEPGGLSGIADAAARPAHAVTTIIASAGYPTSVKTGNPIEMPLKSQSDSYYFHAGTARNAAGKLVTAGGRVLAVTGVGKSLDQALSRSHAAAEAVHFEGMHWRRDIAWRERMRRGH